MILDAIALGQQGCVFVEGGDTVSGDFIGFLVVADAEIGAIKGHLTDVAGLTVTDLTGHTFTVGMYVPLPFRSLTLSSGTLIAVKAGGIQ